MPSTDDAIRRALESRIADIETAVPGYVVAYDPSTRTADVQIATRNPIDSVDGETVNEEREILPSVPIMFPGGGGVRVTWPIEPGDSGLLVTLRYSAQAWRQGPANQTADARDLRKHHAANSVFFPGWLPDGTNVTGSTQPAYCVEADEVRLADPLAVDFAANDTKVQIELTKIAASLTQIATLLNTAGPVVGAPDSVTPYTVPGATAFLKVKGA